MTFDLKHFRTAKIDHRFSMVAVPGLASFFGDDEKPEWKVRNLTGAEVASVREEIERNTASRTAIQTVEQSGAAENVIHAFRTIAGVMPGTVPDEHVRFLSIVRLGSVEPAINHQDAVRLAEIRPIEFMSIGREVLHLTGLGAVTTEKSPPSGEITE